MIFCLHPGSNLLHARSPHVRIPHRQTRQDAPQPAWRRQAIRRQRVRRPRRGAQGSPLRRRSLQDSPRIRGRRQGSLPRAGSPQVRLPRPAGGQDHQRRARQTTRRRLHLPARRPPTPHPHGRPARRGQDHHHAPSSPSAWPRTSASPCSSPATYTGRPP